MNMRPMPPVRAALLALLLAQAPAALAGEDAPYPIWWSPELGLESLDRIAWKLEEWFPREEWYEVVTYDVKRIYTDDLTDEAHPEWGYNSYTERMNIERRTIHNCQTLIAWRDKGFNVDSESHYRFYAGIVDAFYSGYCYALSALSRAKPPKISFLRGFVFDEDAMDYVPPMIGMGWDYTVLYKYLKANRDGVSWKDFDYWWHKNQGPNYKVYVKDENTITVVNFVYPDTENPKFIHTSVIITIYGRGDFNGDGLEDLLIRQQRKSTSMDDEPKIIGSALYVVTRKETDSVLRVVDYISPPPYEPGGSSDARRRIIESGRVP